MRGEGDDKKKEQEGRLYLFEKCPGCGAKLNIGARYCLKCGADYWYKCLTGEWQQICYGSHNPEDAIYSRDMNNIEKCMKCVNVLQRGIICDKKYCFGTGRGKCENCRTFDNTIFDCCQEVQKEDGTITSEDWKALKRKLGGSPGPMVKTLTKTVEQYDDEIPF